MVGLYRAPVEGDNAVLPYVYTCPTPHCVLRPADKLYVIANSSTLKRTIKQIHLCQGDIRLLREIPSPQAKDDMYAYASNAATFWENRDKDKMSKAPTPE